MSLSVIICTYNPTEKIFRRVLDSVWTAANGLDSAEIVIVDNNSNPRLDSISYISEFSTKTGARILTEQKQGLTHARLAGIRDTKAEVVVFVDDDNILSADFFKNGLDISARYPFIGAWSGCVDLEFESDPPEWTKRYWGMLVYRKFKGSRWSNVPDLPETMPCGAGLFIRRSVCDRYVRLHDAGERKIILDRSGDSLLSGGDNDMAICACDIGLGVGLFDEIQLTHFIPSGRLNLSYLSRLAEGIAISDTVLKHYRNMDLPPNTLKSRLANEIRKILMNREDRQIFKSVLEGQRKGLLLLGESSK